MHPKKAPQWSSRDSQPPNAGVRLLRTFSFVDLFNFRQSHRRIRRVAAGLSSMSHNPGDFRNRNRRKRYPRQRSGANPRWNEEYLSCRRAFRMKTPVWWWQQVLLDNKTSTSFDGWKRREEKRRRERGKGEVGRRRKDTLRRGGREGGERRRNPPVESSRCDPV